MEMKKKIACLLAAVLVVSVFTGCGDKKSTDTTETEPTTTEEEAPTEGSETAEAPAIRLQDYDIASLVTLGDYKGLEIIVPDPVVSDEEKEYYMNTIFTNAITEETGIKDRAVAEGDNVFISYVGTMDGEAFDGGTSEGTYLEIGSGSYIEGFEEGLIGVTPGETVDLNLNFPEVYDNNPAMAGKAVVFTTTVNYIVPEMTDETVAGLANENFSTIAELDQYVYDNLLLQAQSNYDTQVQNEISDAVVANATFGEIPAELIEYYTANILGNMQSTAEGYGYDIETYATAAYGADSATVAASYAETYAKQGLVFQAIADAEDLNITDEELDERLMEYATNYQLTSIEELIGDADKNDFRDSFMFEKVMEFLQGQAVIKAE